MEAPGLPRRSQGAGRDGAHRRQDRLFIAVEGHARVYAIANEDLDHENDHKTSAAHFVRFELTSPPMRSAVLAGAAVELGCDHRHYPAQVAVPAETLASLAGDLKAAV